MLQNTKNNINIKKQKANTAEQQTLRIDSKCGMLLGQNKWTEGACDISATAGTACSEQSQN